MNNLTGRSNWFRPGKKVLDNQDDVLKLVSKTHQKERFETRKTNPEVKSEKSITTRKEKEIRVSAPVFIPATRNSSLSRVLRDEAEKMGRLMGWKFKIVEG